MLTEIDVDDIQGLLDRMPAGGRMVLVTENHEPDVTAVQLPGRPPAPGTLALGPDGAVAPFARIPALSHARACAGHAVETQLTGPALCYQCATGPEPHDCPAVTTITRDDPTATAVIVGHPVSSPRRPAANPDVQQAEGPPSARWAGLPPSHVVDYGRKRPSVYYGGRRGQGRAGA
jgi:hypothetical protein